MPLYRLARLFGRGRKTCVLCDQAPRCVGPGLCGALRQRRAGYRCSRERTDCEAALACDRANEPACDRIWRREKFPASVAKSTSRMPDSAALTLVNVTDKLATVDVSWFCTEPREARMFDTSLRAASAIEMAVCAPSEVSTLRSDSRLVLALLRPTEATTSVFSASTLAVLSRLLAFRSRSAERVVSFFTVSSPVSTVPAERVDPAASTTSCVSFVPASRTLLAASTEPVLRS